MESEFLKFPAAYFGGKTAIADLVWAALGQPGHYIEPFAGSCAVLLARPDNGKANCETINDKDGFVCNVWRALQFAPDETAKWCDWPVNHCDLMARKTALIKNEGRLVENLVADEKWCDPVMAGYWIWAASCWIGSGLTRPTQIPHISDSGMGVHAIGQRPNINDGGMGMQEPYNVNIYRWFRTLSERMRYVRVVCGDWTRVCGGDWQTKTGICGMFFDPPYGVEDRDTSIYHHDSIAIAPEVEKWCLQRGKWQDYRIVVAGYEEYPQLVAAGWRVKNWKAQGGYANTVRLDESTAIGKENSKRECLYFSPYCIAEMQTKMDL